MLMHAALGISLLPVSYAVRRTVTPSCSERKPRDRESTSGNTQIPCLHATYHWVTFDYELIIDGDGM